MTAAAATFTSPPGRAESSERAFARPARVLADLPHRTEVVGQVRDAREHAGEFDRFDGARRAECGEPSMCFSAQAASDLAPGSVVDARAFPRLVPCRVGERVAAFGGPPVHQRQTI